MGEALARLDFGEFSPYEKDEKSFKLLIDRPIHTTPDRLDPTHLALAAGRSC